jgi:tRNA G10  N-methylase Trm11
VKGVTLYPLKLRKNQKIMYNTKLNNYHLKPKSSTVYTPPAVSQFIFELLRDKISKKERILDPCAGMGSLLTPWKKEGYNVIGVDLDKNSPVF